MVRAPWPGSTQAKRWGLAARRPSDSVWADHECQHAPSKRDQIPAFVAPRQRVAREQVALLEQEEHRTLGVTRHRDGNEAGLDLGVAETLDQVGRARGGRPVVVVDPHPGAEAVSPAGRVSHVVAVGQNHVGDAPHRPDRPGERLGEARRIHHHVAGGADRQPGGGAEGVLRAVAQVEHTGPGFDLPGIQPPRAGLARQRPDRRGRARLRGQPRIHAGPGARLLGDKGVPAGVAEQVGCDLPAGPAIDAPGVDKPVAGGVGRMSEIGAGHRGHGTGGHAA